MITLAVGDEQAAWVSADDAKPAQATTNDIAVMTTGTAACTNG